jgi:hypothetical protein
MTCRTCRRWLDQIRVRPAVQTGINTPPSVIDRDADDDQARQFAEEARQMVEMGQSRPGRRLSTARLRPLDQTPLSSRSIIKQRGHR